MLGIYIQCFQHNYGKNKNRHLNDICWQFSLFFLRLIYHQGRDTVRIYLANNQGLVPPPLLPLSLLPPHYFFHSLPKGLYLQQLNYVYPFLTSFVPLTRKFLFYFKVKLFEPGTAASAPLWVHRQNGIRTKHPIRQVVLRTKHPTGRNVLYRTKSPTDIMPYGTKCPTDNKKYFGVKAEAISLI